MKNYKFSNYTKNFFCYKGRLDYMEELNYFKFLVQISCQVHDYQASNYLSYFEKCEIKMA